MTIPKICRGVVLVFQNAAPTKITKSGIVELIIPAILLLTLVSAIGNKNMGIKFPQSAAIMSHFRCDLGNFLMFNKAIGESKTPEIRTLALLLDKD